MNEFEKLMGFFHDGLIDRIIQVDRNIYIWMESSQLNPEWIEEFNVNVNDNMSIKGVFHCINVKNININHNDESKIQMNHDRAEILDFEIEGRGISLLVMWLDWNIKNKDTNIGLIKIDADKFYWQYDDYISSTREHEFESSYKPVELEYNNE